MDVRFYCCSYDFQHKITHCYNVHVTCTAKHSRAEDIEMIDRNERPDNAIQDVHHGWCHNEK